MNNLKDVYTENDSRWRSVAVFGVAAFFQVIVMIWTAVHNIPLLMSGIDPDLRWVGIVAALSGELFALSMFILLFFLAGVQRIIALSAYAAMLLFLLANSVVRSVQLTTPDLAHNFYLGIYASFGAPFFIFVVIVLGCVLLVESDPLAELLNARREVQQTQHKVKLTAIRGTRQAVVEDMANPEHMAEIRSGAHSIVTDAVSVVAGAFRGRLNGKEPVADPNANGQHRR